MKGTIYGIFNDENNTCYIGATTQKHKEEKRYGDLFAYKENEPYFKVLDENEYDNTIDLRKLENQFIKCYKLHPTLKCCNIKVAYLPEEEKQGAHLKAKQKYELTKNGKYYKKWANYRYSRKKIILKELQTYLDGLDRRIDIKPSMISQK